jgi:hypothetical protein
MFGQEHLRRRSSGEVRPPARKPEEAPTDVSPDRLTPETVVALQARAGNGAVQRLLARTPAPAPALPSIAHLSPMAQSLLEGVLEKNTIDEAVRQIYDNMFQRTGWTYSASTRDTSGKSYIEAGKTSGMCESYRNAFAEIVSTYDRLRPGHPTDAIKNGVLTIELGNDLASQRFATRKGLTLMGATALKGNVYLEVDGSGTVRDRSTDSISTFVFSGHWTLKVNGKEYDPIFHSINQPNVANALDLEYSYGAGRYLADTSKPVPTGEFGATFVNVTDWATFEATVQAAEKLYDDNTGKVEALLSGSTLKQVKRGIFKPKKARVRKDAADIFGAIADRALFDEVVNVAYNAGRITRPQKKAWGQLSKLV